MPRLTAGTYHVQVKSANMTESQKGTMGITFHFECESGDIDCTRWVTPGTSEYVIKDLDTLGFGRELIDKVENLDRIDEITRGNECQIVVEDEEYKGNVTAKVKWINPISFTGGNAAGKIHSILVGNSITGGAPAPRSAPVVPAPRATTSEPAPFAPTNIHDIEDVPF